MATNKKVIIQIVTQTNTATKGLNDVNKAADGAAKSSDKASKSFLGLGKTFTAIARGFVIVKSFQLLSRAITESVRILADFELAMARVRAISGATEEQFNDLEASARNLALGTIFTATQVAELQLAYSKLGFTTDEILNATEATLTLATITGDDLAGAADVVGATIRGFTLDASEAARVVDVMAKSFTSSALNLENFKQSMKTIAPIANAANISLEESVTFLGVLADSGLRGTRAATGLKNIMADLSDPTSKLARELGRTIDETFTMTDAFEELSKRGIDLAKANELVDKRTTAAFLTLVDGTEKVESMTNAINEATGASKEMAEIIEDTLSVAFAEYRSAIEGFVLREGKGFTDWLKEAIKLQTQWLNRLDEDYRAQERLKNIREDQNDGLENSQIALTDLQALQNANNESLKSSVKILEKRKQALKDAEQFGGILGSLSEDRIKAQIEFLEDDIKARTLRNEELQKEISVRGDATKATKTQEKALQKELEISIKQRDFLEKNTEALSGMSAERIRIRAINKSIEGIQKLLDKIKELKKQGEPSPTIGDGGLSAFFSGSDQFSDPTDPRIMAERAEAADMAGEALLDSFLDRVAEANTSVSEQLEFVYGEIEKIEERTIKGEGESVISTVLGLTDEEVAQMQDNLMVMGDLVFGLNDLFQVAINNRLNSIISSNELEMESFRRMQDDKLAAIDIQQKYELESFEGTQQQRAELERANALEREQFLKAQRDNEDKLRKVQLEEENRLAKQAFNVDQANAVAQIALNTAIGVSKVYGQTGIFGLAAQVPVLAMGALQTATVLAQKFQPKTFEDGGLVDGPSHAEGGVPFTVKGRGGYEMEGGEYIMSKDTVNRIGIGMLDAMNFSNGGAPSPTFFQNGGIVPDVTTAGINTAQMAEMIGSEIAARISEIPVVNVSTETTGVARSILNAEAQATL